MSTNWNEWFGREHPPALKKEWVLSTVWTDCPVEIQDIVSCIWTEYELGNNNYIHKTSIENLKEFQEESKDRTWEIWDSKINKWSHIPINVQPLIDYLEALGVQEQESVIIHHWW